MKPRIPWFRSTVQINMRLLVATAFGWASWAFWPDTVEWWALGLMSILLAMAAFGLVIDAIKLMVRVYRYETMIVEYMAQGISPTTSEMASQDRLRRGGML